jgi:hypothetical protein
MKTQVLLTTASLAILLGCGPAQPRPASPQNPQTVYQSETLAIVGGEHGYTTAYLKGQDAEYIFGLLNLESQNVRNRRGDQQKIGSFVSCYAFNSHEASRGIQFACTAKFNPETGALIPVPEQQRSNPSDSGQLITSEYQTDGLVVIENDDEIASIQIRTRDAERLFNTLTVEAQPQAGAEGVSVKSTPAADCENIGDRFKCEVFFNYRTGSAILSRPDRFQSESNPLPSPTEPTRANL